MADKYDSLREKLEKGSQWPSVYLFKFIVPADNAKIAAAEMLFNSEESEVTLTTSKNGNFVSISAKEMMLSVDGVIERYRQAEKIEGIISL